MKVSLNWIKQFTDVDVSVDELVTKIGEQLGAVEEVIHLGDVYEEVVIAKVVKCEKHPNADKLSVCWIDDGKVVDKVERNDQGLVQVVCGATNVREGLTVAWLPPGSTVPATADKDPFVLEARELRGVISNGMLASAKELAIGDEHEGILEIDIAADPGAMFAFVYQLDDYIIDIENKMFTHRPDCFGILGVAREIAGILNKPFVSPDWYLNPLDRIKPSDTTLPLVIKNEIPDLVPRFLGVAIAGVDVRRSPVTIQSYLSRVGIKPINNLVDITNYLMVLTGQPLHAYDYDKVAKRSDGEGAVLIARMGKDRESVKLLNGKTMQPNGSDIMIATDKEVIGVGGVMGGAETEVDQNTKNIIIECANFNMYAVRKTSMTHGLFTDAVSRFNKGQSPLQNDTVLEEAVAMVLSLAGGVVASDVLDEHGEVKQPDSVQVNASFIRSRLGIERSAEEMANRLKNVEFAVEVHGDVLHVGPPFWRTDIEIAEDIVEEIGRLIGFDKLPIELPKRPIAPIRRNQLLELKTQIRDVMSASGANELLSYSFLHGKLLEAVGQDKEKAFKLGNALSPDLQYYRLSLLPSLLDKVHANVKTSHKAFAVYEIGKVHIKGHIEETSLPKEEERIASVVVCETTQPAFYSARAYVAHLLESLGAILVTYEKIDHESQADEAQLTLAPFDHTRTASIKVDGRQVGFVGEFSPDTRKQLKLPINTAGFELDISGLLLLQKLSHYQPLSRFPSVQQDISMKVDSQMPYGELAQFLQDNLNPPKNTIHRLEPIDIYQKGNDQHVAFRLTIASYDKTMKSEEVNSLLDNVANKAAQAFGAIRL